MSKSLEQLLLSFSADKVTMVDSFLTLQEKLDKEYEEKIDEKKRLADERTARKRAKRLKKKQNRSKNAKKLKTG